MNTLAFKQYRKITVSRLRRLTEQDYHQRGGVIQTREGPAAFQVGDYLGQDSRGEFRIRRVKVERDFCCVGSANTDGWSDYQPLDKRKAAQLSHPLDLVNGQHGEAGDYLVVGSDSEWIVARDVFEVAYQLL